MNILVTGGAGFIGSHLVDHLIEMNHSVIVVDNLSTGNIKNLSKVINKIKFIRCDLSENTELWEREFLNIEYVFHLAALADIVPSIQNPCAYFKSNVISTLNVIEAARKYGVRKIVYGASSSCYGIPDLYPTSETAEINPQYPYALTKRLGEELLMHWGSLYKIPVISLRFFNVYGPRSRTSGSYGAVLGVFIAQKLAKKPLTIVGNGSQSRDFTYVKDIVSALYVSAVSGRSNVIYNVGSGKTITINYLASLIGGDTTHIPKRPGEPDCTYADISKIFNELKWAPKIAIEEGIRETLKDLDYWREAPVWTPESISEATKDWFKFLGN